MSFFIATNSRLDSEADIKYINDLAGTASLACKDVATDGTEIWFPDALKFYAFSFMRDTLFTIQARPDLISVAQLTAYMNWYVPLITSGNGYQVPDHVTAAKVASYNTNGASRSVLDNQPAFINIAYELYLKGDLAWYATNKALLKNVIVTGLPYSNNAVFIPDVAIGQLGYQGWGFMDTVFTSGYTLFANCMTYQALVQLSIMSAANGDTADATDYTNRAALLKATVNANLFDYTFGMYKTASIKCSGQWDVWGSAYAVHVGLTTPAMAKQISQKLIAKKSTWYNNGGIRHVMSDNEFNPGVAIWETYLGTDGIVTSVATAVGQRNAYNRYQNGAHWYTPCFWVWKVIDIEDHVLSAQMRKEAFAKMRTEGANAPYEWFNVNENDVQRYVASTLCNAYYLVR